MENDSKVAYMEKELDKIQNQLDGCEKALQADIAGAVSQEMKQGAISSAATMPVPTDVKAALDKKSLDSIKDLSRQIEELKRRVEQLDEISSKLELLDEMDEEINYIKNFLDTKLNVDFEAMYHNVLEQLNVEAIKVYRNIQAVIVEEDAKQNHVLFGVDGKSDKLKFRMNHVMIFSIISFVVSILVMLMQILPALGINIF